MQSDLWLPLAALAAVIGLPLLLHFLWVRWKTVRAERRLSKVLALHRRPASVAATDSDLSALSGDDPLLSLQALTAQKNPLIFHETQWAQPHEDQPYDIQGYSSDEVTLAAIVTPKTAELEQAFAQEFARLNSGDPMPANSEQITRIEPTLYAPPGTLDVGQALTPAAPLARTVLTRTNPAEELSQPHAVLQYVVRLTWQTPPELAFIHKTIRTLPWSGSFAVQHWVNPEGSALELGLYLVNRLSLAHTRDFIAFDRWLSVLIKALGAKETHDLELQTCALQVHAANTLRQELDALFTLRVLVPELQMLAFEQSLIAAKFESDQAHWFYAGKQRHPIVLERIDLSPLDAKSVDVVAFQMILDVPHLGKIEARRAYMRIRAVARASAAILQNGEGAHLSESKLDQFARDLNHCQEQLIKAGVEPGSDMAKQTFKPRIIRSKDLQTS